MKKFEGKNYLYWVDGGKYSLGVYFKDPANISKNYNDYIDVKSFKF